MSIMASSSRKPPSQREIIDRAMAETGWNLEQLADFWGIDHATLQKYRSGQRAGKHLLRCIALTPLIVEAEAKAMRVAGEAVPTLRNKFEDLLAHGNEQERGIVCEVVGSLWSLMRRRIEAAASQPEPPRMDSQRNADRQEGAVPPPGSAKRFPPA